MAFTEEQLKELERLNSEQMVELRTIQASTPVTVKFSVRQWYGIGVAALGVIFGLSWLLTEFYGIKKEQVEIRKDLSLALDKIDNNIKTMIAVSTKMPSGFPPPDWLEDVYRSRSRFAERAG